MNDDKKDDSQASEDEKNLENDSDESNENEDEQSDDSEDKSDEIDYKAELEAAKADSDKKDEQLKKAGFTIEKLKKESSDANIGEDQVQKMIEEEIARRMSGVEKTALESSAQQVASSIARNDDEAQLIMYHYHNTIQPSGNLKQDMENAQALANRKTILGQLEETKRALKESKASNPGGAGSKITQKNVPKLSAQEASMVASAGMKWNSKSGRYEGKHVALQFNEEMRAWESVRLSQ